MPSLLTRQDYTMWQEDGSRDMQRRIREKIVEIDQTHKVEPLPDNVLSALHRLIQEATAEEEKTAASE